MKNLIGIWEIQQMETWDEDYFNMEVQAYVDIKENKTGQFQFGLVTGYLHWNMYTFGESKRLEFTWEGNDEMDEAFGVGWIVLESEGVIKGEFRLHGGDDSTFTAKAKWNKKFSRTCRNA